MIRRLATAGAGLLLGLGLLTAPAHGREQVLTLYSPKIQSSPYVHETHRLTLRPNGREAPSEPGFITGYKEQALVDSKRPDAKPLPIGKMMIHHLLYFAPGRVDELPGSCWGGSGFIGGRGEEHPHGRFAQLTPPAARQRYGAHNRLPDGRAPSWQLTAMVMNHYKRPKSFYVRTRVYYTTEPRTPITPIVVGNCSLLGNGMGYDVPGGGRRGSEFVERTTWQAPFSGRIVLALSHHHGGAKHHTLRSQSCGRDIFDAPAYYGRPDHIYNTIRPILHEPGPIANGSYGTMEGVPFTAGEVLERAAVHDNGNLHVAAMGFWILAVARDDTLAPCSPLPRDVRQLGTPKEYAKRPNHGLVVPQLFRPRGAFKPFSGDALRIGDEFFSPRKVTVRAGQTVTWRFAGSEPHSVTVANGPRGFSSLYFGRTEGTYSFRPTVPGTYRLTCLVHPTTMGQTVRVLRGS